MDRRDVWLLLPRPLRVLPADLAAVVILTIVTLASVFVPIINETPLRVIFDSVLSCSFQDMRSLLHSSQKLVRVPLKQTKYRLMSHQHRRLRSQVLSQGLMQQLLKEKKQRPQYRHTVERASTVSSALRSHLGSRCDRSVNRPRVELHSVGIRLVPIAASVSLFTLVSVAVAARRRHDLAPEDRFSVPYQTWIETGRSELFDPESRTDAVLNVVLIISILLAISSVGYAVAVPPQGEQFSEFYLLTEDADGELVADGYPEELARGESAEMIVGIENNEYEPTNYTVVVQLQEVEQEGNETRVINRQEVDRFTATLEHNATHHERHVLEPTRTGEELRVQYLLYAGEAPETPTRENSYRDLHLWIDVVEENRVGSVDALCI